MKRLLVVTLLAPALALAAEQKGAASQDDPMSAWRPPKIENAAKDRKEIMALFQAMDAASKRGDIEAAAALVDFPVLMATDDSRGEGIAQSWSREEWIEMMRPFYGTPTDMKVTHKPEIFLLSDSLATVNDVATVKMASRTVTMRNTSLLVRREGKWMVKAMAEAGWGDMAQMQSAAGTSGPASEGTGSRGGDASGSPGSGGSTGTGSSTGTGGPTGTDSSTGTGSPSGTGGPAEKGGSTGTGGGVQEPPQGPTK